VPPIGSKQESAPKSACAMPPQKHAAIVPEALTGRTAQRKGDPATLRTGPPPGARECAPEGTS